MVKEPGRRRVGAGVFGGDLGHDRAEAEIAEDALRFGGTQEVGEGPGLFREGGAGGHRDRVLDQDRVLGDEVFDLGAERLRGDRLVLVGEQDVALAGDERLARHAGGLRHEEHVA